MRKMLTLMLALCGAPAMAEDPHPLFAAGLEAYEFFCSKCHGKDMVNPGTASFDLRKFPLDDKTRFYDSVRDGKGDMPAWGDVIYPEELDALWVYVATRGGTAPLPEEQSALPSDAPHTVAEGTLTACLTRNAGVLSGRRHEGGTGFDYRLSAALAKGLALDLSVVWTEGEQEEDSDPVKETYALLSYRLCDMVPGVPLYQNAVGAPPSDRGALPRWLDMPTTWDPYRQVALDPTAATHAYRRAEIGLVFHDGAPEPRGLEDLGGRPLAMQQNTLSAALVKAQAPQQVVANAVTLDPGAGFLWQVETGAAPVAIVDVAAYDAHLKHNPGSRLRLSEWRHPLAYDIGIAALAANQPLIDQLNGRIDHLRQSGALHEMARIEGHHYTAPLSDALSPPLTRAQILAMR